MTTMNKILDFPHPVLSKDTNDYKEGVFEIIPDKDSFTDDKNTIKLALSYNLTSPGLKKMIEDGKLKVIERVLCFRTSYREQFVLDSMGNNELSIDKSLISDSVDFQGYIVANEHIDNYSLGEFNGKYFSEFGYSLRKGDIVAIEPGFRIKLDTILEKDMAGIVVVACAENATEMSIRYADNDELNYPNYITIFLPKSEYKNYFSLKTKKFIKNGTSKYLIASLILPAITEAIILLREDKAEEIQDQHYQDTIWANSLDNCIQKLEGEDWADNENLSAYCLANKILGNVECDSLNNLMQKNLEWSTIQQGDET